MGHGCTLSRTRWACLHGLYGGKEAPEAFLKPELALRIRRVVQAIPRGKVLGYARVAILAGIPGGARQVGRAMSTLSGLPWWRVLRSDLTLAEAVAVKQARHLRAEGVQVKGRQVSASARATLAEVLERL